MARLGLLAIVAAGALAAAGCGSSTGAPEPDGPRTQAPAGAPTAVETTDGRLGGVGEALPGRPPRDLAGGGRPDPRGRGGAARRDGVGAGAACANPDTAPAAGSLGTAAEATLCLLNGERADHGLAPLALNPRLSTAAGAFAQDLVSGSYFSHTGRDGSDVVERIRRTGYIREDRPWRVGENLAWGTGALATPAATMRAWMNSPGHRENVLNGAYREVGIGVVPGNPARADGAGATYATAFGAIEAAEAGAAPRTAKARKARKARGRRRPAARRARATRRSSGNAPARATARAPRARIAA